eukprot:1880233-Rhodomonas_salina.3
MPFSVLAEEAAAACTTIEEFARHCVSVRKKTAAHARSRRRGGAVHAVHRSGCSGTHNRHDFEVEIRWGGQTHVQSSVRRAASSQRQDGKGEGSRRCPAAL